MSNIFSSLKFLGFNNADKLDLYAKKEGEKKAAAEKKEVKVDIRTLLYDKQVTCPVCSRIFKSRVVKTSAPKVKSRDTDGCVRYETINPYFYDVLVCPVCGYAALKVDFPKIKSYKKEIILMKIGNQWQGREYPDLYDEELAIERYKIALLNAVVGEFKDSTKATLCLKIAWMYRLLEKEKEEIEFLKKAVEGFLIAYESEDTPVYGLSDYSLMYLIGELYRRIGDYDNANQWLGRVIVGRADQKLKDKARDMRDLSREAQLKL